jgi:hypothetical protein
VLSKSSLFFTSEVPSPDNSSFSLSETSIDSLDVIRLRYLMS